MFCGGVFVAKPEVVSNVPKRWQYSVMKLSHSKIGEWAGLVLAPLAYLGYRISGLRALRQLAISLDPRNIRFYEMHLATTTEVSGGSAMGPAFCMVQAGQLAQASSDEVQRRTLEVLPKARGQLLQDIVCLLQSNWKRHGYFVEVGVGDGRHLSNTFLLEAEFGWSGILVEPAREFQANIARHRSAKLEPFAAFNEAGRTLEFIDDDDIRELSGLVDRYQVDVGRKVSRYNVETDTLQRILERNSAPKSIDFLSLDTEGSEVEVLEGCDLQKYSFGFIAVEHNYHAAKLKKLDRILTSAGYRRILDQFSYFDAWYIPNEAKMFEGLGGGK